MNRIDGHGLQRIDFFRHLHCADFRGECRAGPSDDHDSGNQRPEFPRHGNCNGTGDEIYGAKLAQLISALQRKDQPDEKRNQGKDGQGPDTGLHGLRNGALQAQRLSLEGRDECEIRGPGSQRGQRPQIRKPVGNRFSNLRRQFHIALAGLPRFADLAGSGRNGLCFVFVNLENSHQFGKLQNLSHRFIQAEQDQA